MLGSKAGHDESEVCDPIEGRIAGVNEEWHH
jgi:hypothetical protein